MRLCLADVCHSAPCCGVSTEIGGNPVNGIEVCVDNKNSGDADDQASASRQNIGCNDRVCGRDKLWGWRASICRQTELWGG